MSTANWGMPNNDHGNGMQMGDITVDYENEIIICIEVKMRKLGASIYDCRSKTLRILNQDYILNVSIDSTDGEDCSPGKFVDEVNMVLESLILANNPTLCLVSTRLEEGSWNFVETLCQSIGCRVDLQPNQHFKSDGMLESLEMNHFRNVTLLNDISSTSSSNTFITADTVSCILKVLHGCHENNADCSSSNVVISGSSSRSNMISHIESLQLKDRLFMDRDTLYSLNIFPESHRPNNEKVLRGGSLSVFELFQQYLSEMGRRLLRQWMFNPLSEYRLIKERHDIITILNDKTNSVIFENLRSTMKGFPDIFKIMDQFRTGKSTYNTWHSLTVFLKKGIESYHLISTFRFDSETDNLFSKLGDRVNPLALQGLIDQVENIIDIETSKETKLVLINDGIDENLDKYKKLYNNLENILSDVARNAERVLVQLIERQRGVSAQIEIKDYVNAVYIPQLGYLVTLDVLIEEVLPDVNPAGWEEIFRTTTNIYFKNDSVLNLDEQVGDVFGIISDLEIEFLQAFQEHILEQRHVLTEYQKLLLEVEVLLSFAYVSQIRSYVEPEISETECVLEITQGRHPIYETLVESYIPNDINLNGGYFSEKGQDYSNNVWSQKEFNRIAIVTGANQSGKTVFLTQNALIVFLAHIGCFVPAEKAKIGLVDKTLTRIKARESVSKNQSSFALDSQQMAKCLSLMTERSLLFLDEFGKGTDVIDGPAIFGSIIKFLAESRSCPRVLACTHFHELFKKDVLTTSIPGVKHYATEIILDTSRLYSPFDFTKHEENQGITFLFKIKEGISSQSFGVYCAKICGLNPKIVERAQELSSLIDKGYDLVSYCGRLTEEDIKRFEVSQRKVKAFISWDLDVEFNTPNNELKQKLKYILEN